MKADFNNSTRFGKMNSFIIVGDLFLVILHKDIFDDFYLLYIIASFVGEVFQVLHFSLYTFLPIFQILFSFLVSTNKTPYSLPKTPTSMRVLPHQTILSLPPSHVCLHAILPADSKG